MKISNHENIVACNEAYLFHKFLFLNLRNVIWKFKLIRNIFIVLEFMDGGTLTDFIYFKYQQIPENLIAYIIKEITESYKSIYFLISMILSEV